MYLAIDIGGTKTLVASLDRAGEIIDQQRFLTPSNYQQFIRDLAKTVAKFSTKDFSYGCVALPGKIDRAAGIGIACGNLPWKNVPISSDIQRFANCPIVVENDANLAGLSEAIVVQDRYDRVLYITISTGIGTGMIVNQQIDPDFQDSEGGHIILEHHGRRQMWERFASGSAIVRRFGKRAQDITDAKTWHIIAKDLSTGFIDLAAVMQPDVIICGGGVSTFYSRFGPYLEEELARFNTPLTPVPPVFQARRPNEAVIYGCYYLAKRRHEKTHSTATT